MRCKLMLGFLAIILLVWALCVFTVLNTTSVRKVFVELKDDIVPGAITMSKMKYEATEIRQWTLTYIIRGNVIRRGKTIKEWLQKEWIALEKDGGIHFEHEQHIGLEEELAAEKIVDLSQKLISVSAEIIELKDQGIGNEELFERVRKRFGPVFYPLRKVLDEHVAIHLEELSAAETKVHDKHNHNIKFIIIFGSLATLLALFVGLFVDTLFIRYITDRKQAEEKLQESNEYNSNMLDNSPNPIIVINPDTSVRYVNNALVSLTGFSSAELIGRKAPYPWWTEETTKKTSGEFDKAMDKGAQGLEEFFQKKNGEQFRVEITSTPIKINGEFKYYLANWIDITERKRAEEELEGKRAQIKSLFDYSSEAMVLLDLENHIIDANLAFEEVFGYSLEETHGKVIEDLICPERFYYTEAKELDEQSLQRIKGAEIIRMRKDGKEINVRVSAGPIKVGAKITGRFVIFDDITTRKQAEAKLTRTKNFLQNILDSSIDGIITTDLQGNVIYTSPRTKDILGYDQEAAIGKKVYSVYGNGIEDAKTIMRELTEKGEIKGHEMKFIRKDGQFIDINLSASPLRNEEGDITGTLGIYRDITEKNMLETQLAQAQRMEAIGTLAGGIAHNFNNLLMGIQGNASLMLLETDPNHPSYRRLKTIEKSVQSGSRLTYQLLGYAREGKYEVKPISFNQLVEETSNTFETTKKEIRIHQELAEDLFQIKADQGQIEQVLLNFYINAADAMPGGGDLFLKTINVTHKDMTDKHYEPKPGNYVLLTIRDTGVGMDRKTMERIFEPFFTTKGLAKGTGLGLASTYGIIKGHGGYIDVDSEKARGTIFSIYLPASKRKVEEVVKDAGQIIEGDGTILFVDDEEIVLDVGVQLLKALGYTLLEAKGGREAVEIYRENKDKINMVLLDMVMPDMGGGEVYDKMKEINPDIKVLLSSGYSIDGWAEEILDRGCNGFIQKPFNMKGISGKIREILDKG